MTKNNILAILSVIPKTGNHEFDEHIAKARHTLSDNKFAPKCIQSQPETDILTNCIHLMQDVANECADWYDTIKGDGAFETLEDEEDYPCTYQITYDELIQRLFLANTNHNHQPFIRQKCFELDIHDNRLCIHADSHAIQSQTHTDNYEL